MRPQKWALESGQASVKIPKDVISWLLKVIEEKDPSAPPGDQALNEDGRLMIIAGRLVRNPPTALRTGNLTLVQ